MKSKTAKKYKMLILVTGISGAYNLYIENYKKAMSMGLIYLIPFMLMISSDIMPIYGFLNFTLLIPIINLIISFFDFLSYKDEFELYKKTKENKSPKTVNLYKKFILLFGLVGVEDLYIDNPSVIRFFLCNILLYIITPLPLIFILTLLTQAPIVYMYAMMFGPFIAIISFAYRFKLYCIIFAINIIKAFKSYRNAQSIVDKYNTQLKEKDELLL